MGIKMGNVNKKHQPIDELQMAPERPTRVEEDRSTSDLLVWRWPFLPQDLWVSKKNNVNNY